jgi:hypothetical protein
VNYEMFTKMNISFIQNILPTTVYNPTHTFTHPCERCNLGLYGDLNIYDGGMSHLLSRSNSYTYLNLLLGMLGQDN